MQEFTTEHVHNINVTPPGLSCRFRKGIRLFDYFMASIDAMASQVLTVDYVVTRMLNEEAQSEGKSGCRTSAKIRRNLIL